MSKYGWLKEEHEIYTASKDEWSTNERRMRGGPQVLDELVPFDWEDPKGAHYLGRKAQATYINFMDIAATIMSGHLLRQAPEADDALSFGTLGLVARPEGVQEPTRAELVYYNVDGAGNDGSQWDSWWLNVSKRTQATGHRWIMVEATERAPLNHGDEIAGLRPYLVEYSPLSVTNWHFESGRLMWAVIRTRERRPRVSNGKLEGNRYGTGYYLLVREGYADLGSEFVGGGWWRFDSDLEMIEDAHGTWDKTHGEIPLFPFYYDRDSGLIGGRPAMSRPGLTALGQVAVSYMNQSSAADFDAWDAAKSTKFILGADPEAFNVAAEKWKTGNQLVPVPRSQNGDTPQIVDGSTSAVAAEVFQTRIANKWEEARVLAALEASSAPDSSGISKQMGFADIKSPRLATMAAHLEQAQNTAIHFLELRFGNERPEGVVRWPREFDLSNILDDIRDLLSIERQAQMQSATLDARLVLRAAREKGLVADDEDEDLIRDELIESANRRQEGVFSTSSLFDDFGLDP